MSHLVLRRARVPAAVPDLRARTRAWAGNQRLPALLEDDLALVVTELATNAVRHGSGSRVEVRLASDERSVRIEVVDGGQPQGPVPRTRDGECGGRGERLVAAVSDGHGRATSPTGTVAWAVLDRAVRRRGATLRPLPGP
jgi:anti-sigma regulatory factor (Ser/Thr protein kinase)